jgi:O-antigen ligase
VTAPLPLADLPGPAAQTRPATPITGKVALYGTAALLMFAPLAFGAVEPWSIFILESALAILFVIWMIGQSRSETITVATNPVLRPMAAFIALICIQLIPGMSAYRHATYSSLLLYIAYALACFLITQSLTRTRHLRVITTALIVYGSVVAVFAVLQSLSSTGKLYWLRTPRSGGWIYGPYVNHNHYAGLMEMLAPLPLVFAFSRYAHGRRRWWAAGAAAFMGATIFLSGSRGGMMAFALQIALFFWLLFRERRREGVAFLLGAFLLISLALVGWISGSEVKARISTASLDKHSEIANDIRLSINRDTMRMFAKRPALGWGLGTFDSVYPQFRSFYTRLRVDEAHNDYLQLLSETGIVGGAIAIWFLIAVIRPALRKSKGWPSNVNGIAAVASLIGICGILVHSLVDFNLEIPANALLFYVLCTVAAMEPRFGNYRRGHNPQNPTKTWQSNEEIEAAQTLVLGHF